LDLFPFQNILDQNACHAADIAFPIVEPRLPVRVSGSIGIHQRRGSYDVYEITGSCRIEQGDFLATGESLQLWIEKTDVEDSDSLSADPNDRNKNNADKVTRSLYKTIIKFTNGVQVQWNRSDQLRDSEWMGRVFSYSMPLMEVETWQEATSELSNLAWESSSSSAKGFVVPAQFQGLSEQLPAPPTAQVQSVQQQPKLLSPPEAVTPQSNGSVQSSMPLGGW